MPWIQPKTNWTESDFYNFADLNRVESNTAYLAGALSDYSGRAINIVVVTTRDVKRFEFFDSLNRIEGNIQTLANNFFEPTGWEKPKLSWKSGAPFDWKDARRLEKDLQLIYDLLNKAIESLKYCGTFNCGEDGDIY